MDTAGWYPDVILLSTNFYDDKYAEEGGAIAGNLYIQSAFYPFELADDNKATQDYLDLMEQYNPDGKVAAARRPGACRPGCCSPRRPPSAVPTSRRECLLEKAEAPTRAGRAAGSTPRRPRATPSPPSASCC